MIGENIYKLRKQRGLTLSELAEKAVISKSYLSNIERSLNKNPSIHVLNKIANVLQVDLKMLLGPSEIKEESQILEKEWLEFIYELKESGIEKENVSDYKIILEFIKWHQENNTK